MRHKVESLTVQEQNVVLVPLDTLCELAQPG